MTGFLSMYPHMCIKVALELPPKHQEGSPGILYILRHWGRSTNILLDHIIHQERQYQLPEIKEFFCWFKIILSLAEADENKGRPVRSDDLCLSQSVKNGLCSKQNSPGSQWPLSGAGEKWVYAPQLPCTRDRELGVYQTEPVGGVVVLVIAWETRGEILYMTIEDP